ncbi:uncharacterized protein SCDLUD_003448 [Saccharomycodes ludwigii]|uniref:uncharacterized protein n=1 Tax=Saccharomycodes ludwigii TaxID=36035 RepID=UPI001E8820B3|nr:hypothetical protein SCDLUD_003448 [Saccharomycodes ludwigii]KAH3900465.1 hypothetical protein SCDLUD_003448 [Saccharomycodes ludwigii]
MQFGNNKEWYHNYFIIFLISFSIIASGINGFSHEHEYSHFNHANIDKLISLESEQESIILPFNTTRIPGSKESIKIQEYITFFFEQLNNNSNGILWVVTRDNFKENGYNFTNLVFSLNYVDKNKNNNKKEFLHMQDYKKEKSLILAAHYDSKIDPPGFIGAVDSALSCSILLYIAYFITNLDTQNDYTHIYENGFVKNLEIIFFDGEEALKKWNDDDSIYGSKHLVSKYPGKYNGKNIELMILLDLLGSSDDEDLSIYSYFANSHIFYERLSTVEKKLFPFGKTKLISDNKSFIWSSKKNTKRPVFVVEDDHIPFYTRGIPILHLIPLPFPKTWHTIDDDFNHVNMTSVKKWCKMLSTFTVEYLHDRLFE